MSTARCWAMAAALIGCQAQAQFRLPDGPKADTPRGESEFGIVVSTPLPWLYLQQASVRGELKLTKEQIEKIDRVLNAWKEGAGKRNLATGTSGEVVKKLTSGYMREVDESLTPFQKERLNQIIWRHREREYGLPAVLGAVALDLNLSPEQRAHFDRLRSQRAEIVLEHLTSDERLRAIRKQVHDANADFTGKIEALLNEKQRESLKRILGEPFAGEIQLGDPIYMRMRFSQEKSVYLGKLFGRFALEPDYLLSEAIQKELKMESDGIRRAKEFHVEWLERLTAARKDKPAIDDALPELDVFVEKNLGKVLNEKQLGRFEQLMMQQREQMAGLGAACGYPGMNVALALRDDQKDALKDGKSPIRILSPAQLTNYARIVGQRFDAEVKINNRLVADAPPLNLEKPIQRGPAIDENKATFAQHMLERGRQLRLSDEQTIRLKEIAGDAPALRQMLHKELSGLPPPTVHGSTNTLLPEGRAYQQFRKAVFDRCFDVLDKQQQSLHGDALRKAFKDY